MGILQAIKVMKGTRTLQIVTKNSQLKTKRKPTKQTISGGSSHSVLFSFRFSFFINNISKIRESSLV